MPSAERALRAPRVGIVNRLDRIGGVQAVILTLIRGLNERGITPDILWDQPPDAGLLAERGLQAGFRRLPMRVGTGRRERLPDTGKYVASWLNAVRSSSVRPAYDFYYIFYNGFLVDDGTPHVRYLSGPPLIPQLSERVPSLFKAARAVYQGVVRPFAPIYEFHRDSPYVINSAFTAGLFEQAHGVRLPVVYPPIPIRGLGYDPADLPERDTLTFFSRIVDYKRPELALKLAASHPELRVVIMGGVSSVGRPYFEQVQRLAVQLGRPDAVFLANPSLAEVRAELRRTRFYVFPAKNEHFGMTTVEAAALGALPFVHDSGGQIEIVPIDALRFRDENVEERFAALASAPLEQLQGYRDTLRDHIGQYSEDCFLKKMLAYLDRAVGEPASEGRN